MPEHAACIQGQKARAGEPVYREVRRRLVQVLTSIPEAKAATHADRLEAVRMPPPVEPAGVHLTSIRAKGGAEPVEMPGRVTRPKESPVENSEAPDSREGVVRGNRSRDTGEAVPRRGLGKREPGGARAVDNIPADTDGELLKAGPAKINEVWPKARVKGADDMVARGVSKRPVSGEEEQASPEPSKVAVEGDAVAKDVTSNGPVSRVEEPVWPELTKAAIADDAAKGVLSKRPAGEEPGPALLELSKVAVEGDAVAKASRDSVNRGSGYEATDRRRRLEAAKPGVAVANPNECSSPKDSRAAREVVRRAGSSKSSGSRHRVAREVVRRADSSKSSDNRKRVAEEVVDAAGEAGEVEGAEPDRLQRLIDKSGC